MTFMAYTALCFLGLRLLVTLVNFLTRPLLTHKHMVHEPVLVSVLIPARNEALRIVDLLDDLLASDYAMLEILVCDDESVDETASLVRRYEAHDQRVRLLTSVPLPEGWLGKNHACHRLSMEARGNYLIFLDADVRVSPGMIGNTVAYAGQRKLNLLSLFPVQEMKTFGEKMTVPLINWVLLSLLPMRLISWSKRPALAAANGQFMLFNTESYRQFQWHHQVRGERVEDITIIRRMKSEGLSCHTLLSEGQVSCRMYTGFGEAITGFSKNFNSFFGNSWVLMVLFGLLTSFGPLFVGLSMPLWVLGAYLLSTVLLKAMVSVLSRQHIIMNILLMPLQQLSFWLILFSGAYRQRIGSMVWRDRKIIG